MAFYSSVYEALVKDLGVNNAKEHASKSLYLIEIGSNDIFEYFGSSNLGKTYTPPQYVDLMCRHFEKKLKVFYA